MLNESQDSNSSDYLNDFAAVENKVYKQHLGYDTHGKSTKKGGT
jgi:hypothetical protein